MTQIKPVEKKYRQWLKLLCWLIVAAGICFKLIVYLQNRNLLLDEANIARNIYERSFAALATPLSYEQYAPPVFLWIVKALAFLFGYSEYVLRFYSLMTGVAAMLLMLAVLKKIVSYSTAWYPLALFAAAPILVRYASELKQYMPDTMIVLLLLYLALTIKLAGNWRFFGQWLLIGSVAIWASMPSVFVLAGIGFYYGFQSLQTKNRKTIAVVLATGVGWALQFLLYYLVILRPQIGSTYLQQFHQYDFLFATPDNGGEWMHNWSVFNRLLKQFADNEFFVLTNTALLIIGGVALWRRGIAYAALFVLPIAALLAAAALNQFSLMPRVALFSLPLLLLVVAAGADHLLSLPSNFLRVAVLVPLLVCVALCSANTWRLPYRYEQTTEGLAWMRKRHIEGDYLYVHHSTGPAYTYYTQIHPLKNKWHDIANAEILPWHVIYDSLAWQMRYVWKNEKPVAFIFTNATDEERRKRLSHLNGRFWLISAYDKPAVKCYIFDPKPR